MSVPQSEYRVLSISLGGWIAFGKGSLVQDEKILEIFDKAFKLGTNFLDTADEYSSGECEISFSKVLKKLAWGRKDYVISTKLFWSGNGPND